MVKRSAGAVRPHAWQEYRLDSPAGAKGSRRSPDLRCDLSQDRRRWPACRPVGSSRSAGVRIRSSCARARNRIAASPTNSKPNGQKVHVIGGARLAGELDAKRAVNEGAMRRQPALRTIDRRYWRCASAAAGRKNNGIGSEGRVLAAAAGQFSPDDAGAISASRGRRVSRSYGGHSRRYQIHLARA